MAEARFRPRAREDLNDIWRFSAATWSPTQADRYVQDIVSAAENLARFPEQGAPARFLSPDARRRRAGAHVIFYRPQPGGIIVVRVLHARTNFVAHFTTDDW